MQYKSLFMISELTYLYVDVTSLDYILHKIVLGKMFSW